MGCTEPIAIAYAAAVARRTLGRPARRVEVEASGNIIKNVKSVFVPNTGGLRGIPAAAAAGIAAGNPDLELEVLSQIGEAEQAAIRQYLEDTPITVKLAASPFIFDITIRAWAEEESALVRIVNYHTNIVRIAIFCQPHTNFINVPPVSTFNRVKQVPCFNCAEQ